jgi:putative ABC transport system ATP-binding protein
VAGLIELHQVERFYQRGPEEIRAIDGISLSVDSGDYLTIVGPSGSGKTTLLNLIGCIDRPTGGTVRIGDVETGRLKDGELARVRSSTMGFVFQQFFLVPTLTALENVMLPDMFAVQRRRDLHVHAVKLLDMVGVADRADHYPAELSGGEMQRVALARALVNDPVVLLADEPTGNLDSRKSEEIIEIFERLNDEGLTLIVVTHNPELAGRSRASVFLKDGMVESEQRLREPVSPAVETGEPTEEEHVEARGYLPVEPEDTWRAPGLAVLSLLAGVLMFVSTFLPWVSGNSGYGLVSLLAYRGSAYGGNFLVRTYSGKSAVLFTGIWSMLFALLVLAAGAAVLARRSRAAWVGLLAGLAGTALALADIVVIYLELQAGSLAGGTSPVIHPGAGLWMFLGLSVAASALAAVVLVSGRSFRTSREEATERNWGGGA